MPIVFRDFGTANPWALDFSPDRGPATTGFDASHSATVFCDFGSVAEFGNLRLRDSITPAALFINPRIDFVIPQETGSITAVVANAIAPAEWLKTIVGGSSLIPSEWRASPIADNTLSTEWRATFVVDQSVPIETRLTLNITTTIIPIDTKLTPVVVFPISIDWRAPIIRDTTASNEDGLTARADFSIPTDGAALLQRDEAEPLQFLPTIFRDDQDTFESGLTPVAATADDRISIEWTSGVAYDRVAPAEWRTTFTRDVAVSFEWTGGAASYGNVTLTIEFGAGVTASSAPPPELLMSYAADLAIVATADVTAIVDTFPISEYTLSIVGENLIFPDANADRATEDHAIALEWSSTSVAADIIITAGWLQTAFADAVAATDWGVMTISEDTLVLFEIVATPVVFFGDAAASIDWTMPVLVDVVIDNDQWFGREAIGSQLQPDEWEKERD